MDDSKQDSPDTWKGTRSRLRRDAQRLRRYQAGKFGYAPLTWFFDPGWVCVLLHRLSHLLWRRGWTKSARLLMQMNSLLTGADIQPASDLGGGLLIPSPCGVNISARAGENLAALALAGIGGSVRDHDVGAGVGLPLVGRDVTVNWFTGVQGSIVVGDGVVFGPGVGAVVSVATGAHMSLRRAPLEGELPATVPTAPSRSTMADCGHAAWRQTRADIDADIDRYVAEQSFYGPAGRKPPRLSASLTNPLLALRLYRLSHWMHLNGWRRSAMLMCKINILLHKLTIPPCACLGGGVLMPHLGGTVFSGHAGARLTLYAGALCTCHSGALAAAPESSPLLGDDVLVAGHAGIFGPITVGEGAQLGPKAQLIDNLDAGAQAWDPLGRGSAHAPGETLPQPSRNLPAPQSHPLAADHPWRETWRRLRQDRARLLDTPRFPALTCVRLYRLSHAFHATGWRRLARWTWLINIYLSGADITPCCELAGGLLIPHPAGVALHCRAGEGLTVGAIAGITAPLLADDTPSGLDRSPLLGDGVHLAHHSGVFGAVTVGDGVMVQTGCVVTQPVPGGVAVLPRRLRVISRSAVARKRSRADAERDSPVVGSAELP